MRLTTFQKRAVLIVVAAGLLFAAAQMGDEQSRAGLFALAAWVMGTLKTGPGHVIDE